MLYKGNVVCFTGHRELKEPYSVVFTKTYREVESLIKQGYKFFGAGGARGFDTIAAEVVIQLQQQYSHIHLILVLPYHRHYEYEKGWKQEEIELLEKHKKMASKVIYTQEAYGPGCYYKRDRHLVDHASLCLCYRYKSSGGTAYTTNYAYNKGLKVLNIVSL